MPRWMFGDIVRWFQSLHWYAMWWRLAGLFLAIGLALLVVTQRAPAADAPPRRVVSINLCTDQLAMLLAAPGQLHSVSYLAHEEGASVLAAEAKAYPANHVQAEEIFLMKPDLVLAGTFTTRATVGLLRRLGFRVEEFAPEESFADISANLRRMGALLGQPAKAEELIASLDARLRDYAREPGKRPLAAFYYANSYTSGGGTLAGEVVERAGLDNLGKRLGYVGTTTLPLEALVMNAPDFVIASDMEDRDHARAYSNLAHPALAALRAGRSPISMPDKYTICGAPFTAEAVRILAEATVGTGAAR
jgi:iron complex transport system substrate-binding protein